MSESVSRVIPQRALPLRSLVDQASGLAHGPFDPLRRDHIDFDRHSDAVFHGPHQGDAGFIGRFGFHIGAAFDSDGEFIQSTWPGQHA